MDEQAAEMGALAVEDEAVARGFAGAAWRELRVLRRGFENWPALAARLAAGRLAGRPPGLELRARSGEVACSLPGDRSWRTLVETLGADSYRLGAMGFPRAPIVVDVGANLGGFTLAMLRTRPLARVLAYEPSPAAFGAARENLARNGVLDRVELQGLAVTGTPAAQVILYEQEGDLCTSSTVERSGEAPDRGLRAVTVPARSLTELLTIIDSRVDLLKLDVEGGEYDIVVGSAPAVFRSVERIVLEYHRVPGHDVGELATHLAAAGFVWERQLRSARPGQGLAWWRSDNTSG